MNCGQNDVVNFTGNNISKNEKPVDFKEGIKLAADGFWNKTKDLVTSIVHHPVQTAAVIGGTALAVNALPFIGISASAGAGALALGFGAYAIYNTVKHSINAVKHNKNQQYDKVREDVAKIGGDSLDLALSLPFVPKGYKSIKTSVKYGPKAGINKELINGIKDAKGFSAKMLEYRKAELRIKYHQIAEEMGCKVKPKLVFSNEVPQGLGGLFDPTTGEMIINEKFLSPAFRSLVKSSIKSQGGKLSVSNLSPEGFLRHELEHFTQFKSIVQNENIGINGLKSTLMKYHSERLAKLEEGMAKIETQIASAKNKNVIAELKVNKKFLQREIDISKAMAADADKAMNTKFYEDIVTAENKISAGSKEAAKSEEYLQALMDKLNDSNKMEALQKK